MDGSSTGVSFAFLLLAGIGAIALVAGLYFAGKTVSFRLRAVPVQATLVENFKTECRDMTRDSSVGSRQAEYYTCYQPIVEYEVGEYVYTGGLIDRSPRPYETGSTFAILVDSRAPEKVMMQDRYWVFSALLVVFGLFFIVGGLVFK